ncbi:ATP synthase a chain, putative [Entamoeba dispar SAW760]|uniref:ATP synthase a chain, putative n=1 Tax=Entamoeba dispar (strain ATCC PRA-260 / SAW760) TaxID=370354 RepID=B0EFV1_ENTDS|nr:ATP synthase a chain, putative [Entamoeba dispar SAW760]EDR26597.1 ATP synthase a chain, putative [Entamoeba dispar SAW760]|eukprot:EDR26597.1 ATP synthase a chain, putative [Entamoeba dispar SAW760]
MFLVQFYVFFLFFSFISFFISSFNIFFSIFPVAVSFFSIFVILSNTPCFFFLFFIVSFCFCFAPFIFCFCSFCSFITCTFSISFSILITNFYSSIRYFFQCFEFAYVPLFPTSVFCYHLFFFCSVPPFALFPGFTTFLLVCSFFFCHVWLCFLDLNSFYSFIFLFCTCSSCIIYSIIFYHQLFLKGFLFLLLFSSLKIPLSLPLPSS